MSALAFDACGERLAVGFWYPGERVDVKTGRTIEEDVPQDDIAVLEVPSGRVVAWLDQQAFNLRSSVTGLAFTPDGQHLVSADTGDVCYFDLRTGKQLWAWSNEDGGDGMSCAIECCSNSPYIATWGHGCREGAFDTRNGRKVTYDEGRSSRTWCVSEPLRLFARSDVDVLDLFGADELDLRAQRVRISAEDEFVHTPSGWWDGTVGGLRGAKVFTVDGRPVDVEREARRRWDPKRVRASIAGVNVRPPRSR
ncbi:MAG: WD40 repeat domain-containing protein [Planctomycetes bacterium]|nr:WD40 repeat domain-containing protein [Planctomycetota bacterium]